MEAERFPEAARLFDNGLKKASQTCAEYERFLSMLPELDESMRSDLEHFHKTRLVDELSKLHAVLLLAGSDSEAREVAGMLIETLDDGNNHMALAHWGMKITGRAYPSSSTWLDEAEQAGSDVKALRERLGRL